MAMSCVIDTLLLIFNRKSCILLLQFNRRCFEGRVRAARKEMLRSGRRDLLTRFEPVLYEPRSASRAAVKTGESM